MKEKNKRIKKIIFIIAVSILGSGWALLASMAVIGGYFPDLASPIEDFLALTGDQTLLKTSILYLLIDSVLLVFTLLFKDFKKKFID